MKINPRILARFMLASSIALGVSLPAAAGTMKEGTEDCREWGRMHHAEGTASASRLPRFLHGLDLTAAQQDRISGLFQAQEQAIRDKVESLHKSRAEIRRLSVSGEYDEEKIKALSESGARAMAAIAQLRARTEHEVYQVLTPAQRKQLEEQRERYMSQRMGREAGRREG